MYTIAYMVSHGRTPYSPVLGASPAMVARFTGVSAATVGFPFIMPRNLATLEGNSWEDTLMYLVRVGEGGGQPSSTSPWC